MTTQKRLTDKVILRVGKPEDFSDSEINDVCKFIDKEHYLGYPYNKDGSKNPYQYCYGVGYLYRNDQIWAGFVAGIYPNSGFWNKHFPLLVGKRGIEWIFRHTANIYRIVAFYQADANALLKAYEEFCYKDKRTKIIMALPTKKEKDAVCNWNWFAENNFKDEGYTENKEAKVYVKIFDFEPIETSPFELARQEADRIINGGSTINL